MKVKKIINQYGLLLILLFLIISFGLGSSSFFSVSNFITIIRQITVLIIITIGMSIVLISGGIDLSVGTQLSFIGVVTASIFTRTSVPPLLACFIGVLIATLVGLINGLFISNTKVPPLIATLAMQQILNGLGYIISRGRPIYGLDPSVQFIGQGYVGIIPFMTIIMFFCVLFGLFILNKTYIGRSFYVIGNSEEVGRLSGIKTKTVKTTAFVLCGMLAGIAAIIMMSRINSGSPTVGRGFEMDVLTAAVLGGVSVSGGEGKLSGAIVGALILGVLSNGLIIMNVGEYYQMVIKGLVLATAIAFDCMKNMKTRADVT